MIFSSIQPKRIVFFMAFSISVTIYCQSIKPFIGIHGGINFTQPKLITHYEIITNINDDETANHQYKKLLKNVGNQIGFSIYLKLNDHFSLGFLPELSNYSYTYQSREEFINSQGDSVLAITDDVNTKLNYYSIPIIIQYNIKDGPFVPYLFAGGAYSFLKNAQQSVKVLSSLQTQGTNLDFGQTTTNNFSSGYIKSKLSAFGGIGISYEFNAFTLALDAAYWFGFNNIVNEKNRYSNSSISGSTYELPDDLKINHLVINAFILFPINKNEGKKASLECIPFKNPKR
jgi:hypothetical protein